LTANLRTPPLFSPSVGATVGVGDGAGVAVAVGPVAATVGVGVVDGSGVGSSPLSQLVSANAAAMSVRRRPARARLRCGFVVGEFKLDQLWRR